MRVIKRRSRTLPKGCNTLQNGRTLQHVRPERTLQNVRNSAFMSLCLQGKCSRVQTGSVLCVTWGMVGPHSHGVLLLERGPHGLHPRRVGLAHFLQVATPPPIRAPLWEYTESPSLSELLNGNIPHPLTCQSLNPTPPSLTFCKSQPHPLANDYE
jgi:hypothetical protein